jgi:hemolysin activation/secretion protein
MKHTALLCLVFSVLSSVSGQNVEKNSPRELKTRSSSELLIPEVSDELSEENDRVLIEELISLQLFNGKHTEEAFVKSDLPVQIAAELLISEDAVLSDKLGEFLGSEITFADIVAIKQVVYGAYREKGFPVVDVSIPEQEITDGQLRLIITESVLGKIGTEGGRYLNETAKLKAIRHSSGEPINAETLQEDLDWLNRDPYASADLILSPGEGFGESDLSLALSNEFPVYAYFGYENTGNDATDLDRYFIGGSWGNVFNLGHLISYQYTTSGDLDELSIHSADYKIRLPWRDEFTLSGIYSESQATIEGDLFDTEGESWYIGARYWTSLPEFRGVIQSATIGFDFKRTNNDTEFGGVSILDSSFDIVQWLIRYNASVTDKWGATDLALSTFYSPGNLTNNNEDGIVGSRFVEADYIYGFLELSRVTYLPAGFLLNTTASGQLSDSSLFISEQFGLGGFNTVRGYDYREVNGDEGYLVNVELRSPTLDSRDLLSKLSFNAETQLLAFWDFGYSRTKGPEIPDVYVASYGLGLRTTVTDYVQASVDYGWQLRDIESAAGDGRFHVNVTMIF